MNPEKPKPKVNFFIVSKVSQDPNRDFQELLLELKEGWMISVIQSSSSQAALSNNMGYSSDLSFIGEETLENTKYPFSAKLSIHPEDGMTFNAVRRVLWILKTEYKLYSETYKTFIPKNPDLLVEEIGEHNKEVYKILNHFGLNPVYFYDKTQHYFAQKDNGKVAIVNPYLLDFLYKKETPERRIEELSYEVAKDMKSFSGMFEKGLLPVKFYEYYKKDFKIINKSFFDIENPGRKVFIKPLIFEFERDSFEFYTYAANSSSSLLFMDKIRSDETLNESITRVLKEDLKIADDYLGAVVSEYVEFDRDKEGVLTPRLTVSIYVDKIKNKEWAQKMSQTSWRSLDGRLASEPPENNSD